MKKKTKIIVISISLLVIFVILGFIIKINLIDGKKNDTGDKMHVSGLEQITVLSENNSAKASELIKSNIVKIINKIDDTTSIIGTGFFDKSGYIVTNSHIVDIKGSIFIEYASGEEVEAQLYSNDITSDIALLVVEKPLVKAVSYGKTLSLNITDDVYAVGYPFVLKGEASVSKGILSARRSAGGIEFLQSDISLNTGNSGGPLINEKGEVLGINTYATENASIGMAISSESLENIIAKLIVSKSVSYLEDTRPSNALSVVLTEIGHHHDDIYHEKGYIHKHNQNKDEDNSNNNDNNGNDNNNHDKDNNNSNDEYKKTNSENNITKPSENNNVILEPPEPVVITDIPFEISKINGSGHIVYNQKIKQSVMSFSYSIVTKDGISPTLEQFGVDSQKINYTSIDIVEKAVLEVTSRSQNERLVLRKEIPGSDLIIKNGVQNHPYILLSEIRDLLTQEDIYIPNNQYVLYSSIEVTFKNGKGTFKNGDWSYIDP